MNQETLDAIGAVVAQAIKPVTDRLDRLDRTVRGIDNGEFNPGMAGTVREHGDDIEEHGSRITKLEDRWKVMLGVAAGVGIGSSGVTALIIRVAGG